MRRLVFVALALAVVALATPSSADQLTPKAALDRLWSSDKVSADWFAPVFLAAVPVTQVQTYVDQYKAALGAYHGITGDGPIEFSADFDKGSVPCRIHLDDTGKIDGLFFKNPVPKGSTSTSSSLDDMRALRGKVSVIIEEGGREKAAFNADEPLAVGSAFKLAVLDALQKQAAAGRHPWTQVVSVRDEWKSLPTGILQTWPAGTALTLQSTAALMISQSDNTAADLVMHTLGRSALEAESKRNTPFLTTREMTQLKDPANAALLERWRKGDAAARRMVLAQLAGKPLPSASIFTGEPLDTDVEWFLSVRELCALMQRVAPLPLTTINPGPVDRTRWERISYKGGSEPGVLNLTAQVTNRKGMTYCVSATWNDSKPLNETEFSVLYSELLNSLE